VLVLLVLTKNSIRSRNKILAVKAGTSIWPSLPALSAHLACFGSVVCAIDSWSDVYVCAHWQHLLLLKWIFGKLICFEQTIFLTYLWQEQMGLKCGNPASRTVTTSHKWLEVPNPLSFCFRVIITYVKVSCYRP
jgi:hypothetical protein